MNPGPPVPDRIDAVSEAVVTAVAESEGVDSTELSPPLYHAVDPDALDSLFSASAGTTRGSGRVTFTYCGYAITVEVDGTVVQVEVDG